MTSMSAFDPGQIVEWIIVGLSGGGVVELIRSISRRKKSNVEVVASLNDATLKWAQALEADADSARKEAQEAWKAAREARIEAQQERDLMRNETRAIVSELQEARQMAEVLTYRLRRVTGAIMSPTASLPTLREMVKSDPGLSGMNGTGS